jgi:hypothetical protein
MTKTIKNDGKESTQLIISAKTEPYQSFCDKYNSIRKSKASDKIKRGIFGALCDFYGVSWSDFLNSPTNVACRRIYSAAKMLDVQIIEPDH